MSGFDRNGYKNPPTALSIDCSRRDAEKFHNGNGEFQGIPHRHKAAARIQGWSAAMTCPHTRPEHAALRNAGWDFPATVNGPLLRRGDSVSAHLHKRPAAAAMLTVVS